MLPNRAGRAVVGTAAGAPMFDAVDAPNVLLVVLACSFDAEQAFLLRQAARRTWMQWDRSTHSRFVLSASSASSSAALREEQERNDDIMFVDAPDDYESLSLKVQLAFRGAITLFPSLTHVLKTDDDSWVHVPVVRRLLSTLPGAMLHAGRRTAAGAGIYSRGSNTESEQVRTVFGGRWPTAYMSGAGYILSADLVRHIAAPPLPRLLIRNEDAGVGIALLPYNVTYVDLSRALNRPALFPGGLAPGNCVDAAAVALIHTGGRGTKLSPALMEALHRNASRPVAATSRVLCGPAAVDWSRPRSHGAPHVARVATARAACRRQANNLGTDLTTHSECAQRAVVAMAAAPCRFFMFSTRTPQWGCRCCEDASTKPHAMWNVYRVEHQLNGVEGPTLNSTGRSDSIVQPSRLAAAWRPLSRWSSAPRERQRLQGSASMADGVPFLHIDHATGARAIICLSEKAGSTSWKWAFGRAAHPKLRALFHGGNNPHGRRAAPVQDFDRASVDPTVPRIMIVRNPYSRLLAGYLDKIAGQYRHDPSNRLGKHTKQLAAQHLARLSFNLSAARTAPVATFPIFARFLMRLYATTPRTVNPHFTPQADKCQWERGYDFYLPVEQMHLWYMPFARALELVETLASGWNSTEGDWANHSQPCFYSPAGISCADFHAGKSAGHGSSDVGGARPESFHATGSDSRLGQYFDGALIREVGEFGERDLRAFGYPRWDAGVEAATYLKTLS